MTASLLQKLSYSPAEGCFVFCCSKLEPTNYLLKRTAFCLPVLLGIYRLSFTYDTSNVSLVSILKEGAEKQGAALSGAKPDFPVITELTPKNSHNSFSELSEV